MGLFHAVAGGLEWRGAGQFVRIEAWGPDSLRVRSGVGRLLDDLPGALLEPDRAADPHPEPDVELPPAGSIQRSPEAVIGAAIGITGPSAVLRHGALQAQVTPAGVVSFHRADGAVLLAEQPAHFWWPGARHFDPLGNGRYLMEPMILARLIQTLQPQPEDRALVVESGAGYGTALLARLVKSVVALESDPALAGSAEQTIKALGIANVTHVTGAMEAGRSTDGPYDVILIEGSVQHVPPAIVDQLAEGGRLGTVIAAPSAGVLGLAQLIVKEGGVASGRPIFDAGTPALPGFASPPRFTF